MEYPFELPNPTGLRSDLNEELELSSNFLNDVSDIEIFPNPVNDRLSLSYKPGVACQVQLFNLNGERLHVSEFIGSASILRESIQNQNTALHKGQILIVKVVAEDGQIRTAKLLF